MIDTAVIIAIIGVLSATVAALIWIIKYLFSEFKPALDGLTKSSEQIVRSTDQNTVATKSADVYLRERNGRDNEFHGEVMVALQNIPIQQAKQNEVIAKELKRVGDITAAQLKEVGSQQVTEQHVEHQVVQNVEAPADESDTKT